jgi:uncharacterized protein with HEPN domain
MRKDSLYNALALIGELSKKLSEEVKPSIPLPWKEIIGFRDRQYSQTLKK